MSSSSNTTRLLNCLIALATKTPDFPHPLYDKGFQLETIEPNILLLDGHSANPDIQFKKNDNQLVFFECKDGACRTDQLERYKKLTLEDIIRGKASSLPGERLNLFDLAYFGTKEKEEKLMHSARQDGNPFPIVLLDEHRISWQQASGRFKDPLLSEIFTQIDFERSVPTTFIPFCASDDDDIIIVCLLQQFLQKFEYSFTLDELLDDLFSHIINHYSVKGKDEMKGRIGRLLKTIMTHEEFSSFLSYDTNTRKFSFKTMAPVTYKRKCEKFIEDCEKMKKEGKIAKLDDFLGSDKKAWL